LKVCIQADEKRRAPEVFPYGNSPEKKEHKVFRGKVMTALGNRRQVDALPPARQDILDIKGGGGGVGVKKFTLTETNQNATGGDGRRH